MASQKRSRPYDQPVAVEIFAGIGGLSLGIERAGFALAAAVELSPIHAAVHSYNFPRTTLLQEDASRLKAESVREAIRNGLTAHGRTRRWNGRIDLLAGGPPCQGFSVGGTDDPTDIRNELLFAFSRAVGLLRPRYFIMENVPGLLREKHRPTLERLLSSLDDAGYDVSDTCVLNAADFGVPQVRKRLFLFGWRRGESSLKPPEVPKSERITVSDAFRGLPDAAAFPDLMLKDVLPFDMLSKRTRDQLLAPGTTYSGKMRADSAARGFTRHWSQSVLSGMALTEHTEDVVRRFQATQPGQRETISRYARLDPAGLSPTLRSGTGPDHGSHTPPRPIHPSGSRVITAREAARLHSFPDWFTFHATKWHAWRGIGNSVPPILAEAVARRVAIHTEATDHQGGVLPRGDLRNLGYGAAT